MSHSYTPTPVLLVPAVSTYHCIVFLSLTVSCDEGICVCVSVWKRKKMEDWYMASAPTLDEMWQSYNEERNRQRAEEEIAQRREQERQRESEREGQQEGEKHRDNEGTKLS